MWKEKEYFELLETSGIDTVCFMGSGYNFEDYNIGQDFYFPFAWYEVEASIKRGFNLDECFKKIKIYNRLPNDRFKLIRKYEFKENKIWGGKLRYEKCLIKNLRTKEVIHLKEDEIDKFFWCLMAEPV